VVVEVLALDEVTNVLVILEVDIEEELVTTEEVAVEVLALEEVTNVLVILEVDIEEVVGCDGLDKDALEETIG
jgi:hypothetical protein